MAPETITTLMGGIVFVVLAVGSYFVVRYIWKLVRGDIPVEEGRYMWVNRVYGGAEFPYPVLVNPHGDAFAVWRVIEAGHVFMPHYSGTEKPAFEVNANVDELLPGDLVYGFRKVMSGKECDGEPHIICLDPLGGGVKHRKVELVGVINENGDLE